MNRKLVFVSAIAGSVALLGMAKPNHTSVARSMEVARLRSHFDSVDYELRSRDVSAMSASQLAHRAQVVSWLRDYRNAGRFPTNDRFAVATPFFRDKYGVLCAMAYLIDRSGRGDIVNKVAASRNNAYIRELADDPALLKWLDEWGLSVAEAARIQPTYGGGGEPEPTSDDAVESDYAIAGIALGSVSLATAAVNVMKPSYISGALGVVAGTVTVITGAGYLHENSGTDRVATAMIGLGAVSIGSGIYGLLEARSHHHDGDRDRYGRRRRYSLNVAPDVQMSSESPRVGVLIHGRF